MERATDVDVVIVGAGAAGIGAALTAREHGLSFELLEASHRIGGRALTEEIAPGIHFDLGCHWLHSASINPLTAVADRLGMRYTRRQRAVRLHDGGGWVNGAGHEAHAAFERDAMDRIEADVAAGHDRPVADLVDREHRWTEVFDSWIALMTSVDSDQVSAIDLVAYRDTEENWPLEEGYGTLVGRLGADLPARLNTAARAIDWSARGVRVETGRGTVRAARAIVTASTNVLASGDIRFTPALPAWKSEAIEAVPLGCNNCIALVFDRQVFEDEATDYHLVLEGGDAPISIRIRPFGRDMVIAFTGGRHAAWLERAGNDASFDLVESSLATVFGNDCVRHVSRRAASAWGGDPFIRGSYSAAAPGRFASRALLRETVGERIHFAGEATSEAFFSTCHGAYLTGVAAARAVAAELAGDVAS